MKELDVLEDELALEEKQEFKDCIIYPENRTKQAWELFMIVILLISCLITPVEIAFAKSANDDDGFDS